MLEGMQQLLFSTTSAFCIGFVSGLLFIFLLAGSIITQSPKRIPTMLIHSGKHGF